MERRPAARPATPTGTKSPTSAISCRSPTIGWPSPDERRTAKRPGSLHPPPTPPPPAADQLTPFVQPPSTPAPSPAPAPSSRPNPFAQPPGAAPSTSAPPADTLRNQFSIPPPAPT